MQRRHWMRGLGVLALGLSIAGCERASDPSPALQHARALIVQAERTGAKRLAAADLQQARRLMRNAEAAQRIGRSSRANQLAHEASLEARLAIARTAAVRASQSLPVGPQSVP